MWWTVDPPATARNGKIHDAVVTLYRIRIRGAASMIYQTNRSDKKKEQRGVDWFLNVSVTTTNFPLAAVRESLHCQASPYLSRPLILLCANREGT